MKVELSEQDIANTVGFLNRANLIGEQALTLALLIQMYQAFLQPNKDGASEEEIPTEEATT